MYNFYRLLKLRRKRTYEAERTGSPDEGSFVAPGTFDEFDVMESLRTGKAAPPAEEDWPATSDQDRFLTEKELIGLGLLEVIPLLGLGASLLLLQEPLLRWMLAAGFLLTESGIVWASHKRIPPPALRSWRAE